MKRTSFIFGALASLCLVNNSAHAQLSQGGLPLSIQSSINQNNYIPKHAYDAPNWQAQLDKEALDREQKNYNAPTIVALRTLTDVKFPESGSFETLDNGTKIWRTQIQVSQAPGIGLYFKQFKLPKGAKLFVSNANGKQVLGAFTSENNDPSKEFAIEPIQGELVNIEINLDPNVNINDLELNIDRVAVYHRAIENLLAFVDGNYDNLQTIDQIDNQLIGNGSVCHINAVCPEGNGYEIQRNATAQFLHDLGAQGVGLCSGTMVNNTGNVNGVCKQYFLAASHCEGTGSIVSSSFNTLLVRFNFQRATCTGTDIPNSNTVTGANFVARANYNESVSPDAIKGDFLLLELRQAIPASWNVNLAGWNKNPNIATSSSNPDKHFIGFHHPSGDAKKVSHSQQIQSYDLGAANTHWLSLLNRGYVEGGSSGSGLFNPEGQLIGIASVAGPQNVPANCNVNSRGQAVTAMNAVIYSKLAYDWDYSIDGTGTNRKLKPWLDPTNSGVNTIPAVTSTCQAISGGGTGINSLDATLDGAINVYPNPSTDGIVNVKINLADKSDLTIEIFDVLGSRKQATSLTGVTNHDFKLDLSSLANGMYMIKFSTGNSQVTKKVMINK